MKGDGMAKRSSFGSIARKKLSDVTNVLPQPKSPIDLENPLPDDSSSAKDYIDHLVKENMALVKLIQDQKKIIELSGLELQKLRVSLQKLQQQNWSLAQSNSHMLAELNLGKDKLKTLRHELMCKEALLKAKSTEAKEQERMNCQTVQGGDGDESRANKIKGTINGSKQHCLMRSRSVGPSSTSQQVLEKEPAENKRRCVRRKSAGFKIQQQKEPEPSENLFEIEDTKLPIATQPDIPTPLPSFENEVEGKDEKRSPGSNLPRSSLGRPLRKAAEKVQSYKEIPLNVKMRRTE